MSQSSSSNSATDCKHAVDGNSSAGWESGSNGAIGGHIQIGFHTIFTVNKLRIQQSVVSGRQIQELLMEFSDCSHEKVRNKVYCPFRSSNGDWGIRAHKKMERRQCVN